MSVGWFWFSGYPPVSLCVTVAAVPNLASAAGWLTISQLISLIGNQSAANAGGIKGAELQENGRVSRHVLRSARCAKTCVQTKPHGDWLILGAGGGNPRVEA
ncbi:hypothetical protein EYF80_063949 [Liparis tanakae]|uniref:Uncharacterized protein n=1 Tax=Liparis tanakae TaxID=230148 RepID=A0A4Z2EAY9_9TELE|nr:hypothetical protein EYF80_063949 [Liparis tanakae]